MKHIFIRLIVLCVFLLSPVDVFALDEFSTSLDAQYTVNANGSTTVRQNIRLKNNFSTIYATKYALEIGSTRVANIRAYTQDSRDIPMTFAQTDNKTSIALEFEDKVVGKDQERVFTIEYVSQDISVLSGNVLEVSIPKLSDKDEFSSYTVSLEVPKKFGDPALVFPETNQVSSTQSTKVLQFGTTAVNGIYVIFGEKQVYDLSLKYHIQNPTVSQGVAQVALPPDTPYQRMIYSSIDPKPDSIELDHDGNWIATFTIRSQAEQTIVASASAIIYLNPVIDVPIRGVDEQYLTPQKYWQVDDSNIQSLGKKLKTPRAIYDYVIKTLTYNYARLENSEQIRQGAVEALANPSNAVCQEYVDVFVSLARAAGIPTREIDGYAYTQNPKLRPLSLVTDVLHAWPEYYDTSKHMWQPIDPTWADTTGGVDFFSHLDFNHITFAIHGLSSEKPYPAGVYKISGKEEKDVEVTVAKNEPKQMMDVDVLMNQSPVQFLSLSRTVDVTVENKTGSAWYNIPVQVAADAPLKVSKGDYSIDVLLPYQKKTFVVGIEPTSTFPAQKGEIHVTIGSTVETYEVTAGPYISSRAIVYAQGAALGAFVGLVAYGAWRLLVSRKK